MESTRNIAGFQLITRALTQNLPYGFRNKVYFRLAFKIMDWI